MHEEETNSSSKQVGPELKECPFCGAIPIRRDNVYRYGSIAEHPEGTHCPIENTTIGIRSWNLRIPVVSTAPPHNALIQLLNGALLHPESAEGYIRRVIDELSSTAPGVDKRRLEIALGYIKRAANRELPKLPCRVDEMTAREVAIFNVGAAAVGNLQFITRELDALPAAAPPAPKGEEAPIRREIRSSRHPRFTAADHERMKATLDSLSDYPTEEEAEAALQACGTSGKEVVNDFIERLLKENLELKTKLAATIPPAPVVSDCGGDG